MSPPPAMPEVLRRGARNISSEEEERKPKRVLRRPLEAPRRILLEGVDHEAGREGEGFA